VHLDAAEGARAGLNLEIRDEVIQGGQLELVRPEIQDAFFSVPGDVSQVRAGGVLASELGAGDGAV